MRKALAAIIQCYLVGFWVLTGLRTPNENILRRPDNPKTNQLIRKVKSLPIELLDTELDSKLKIKSTYICLTLYIIRNMTFRPLSSSINFIFSYGRHIGFL
ncbi:unnamed protein product [Acanthoscelides obtectus]|uniref:Uncharacterized protein n=1 Tax=Acanthoscelides obtectus TaxID=200917 RepID=A0A9P0NT48_ACAOB|nr:unnamed protein product [Acanthoscelides obtectus]CAK1657955.1 hypothetical protein AOBTE_LOCUS20617 [Acanthoscelides obtectus]